MGPFFRVLFLHLPRKRRLRAGNDIGDIAIDAVCGIGDRRLVSPHLDTSCQLLPSTFRESSLPLALSHRHFSMTSHVIPLFLRAAACALWAMPRRARQTVRYRPSSPG